MHERERGPELTGYHEPEDIPWRWGSLRSFGISVGLWPIEWALGTHRADDQFGGSITVMVGPLEFTISYNDGSALRAKSR